jgi:hypothetical protein
MGLAAAELGSHIENRRGFRFFTGKTGDHLGSQIAQILGQEGSFKKTFRFLVIGMGYSVSDLVQMNGKLRGTQGPPFP